MAKLISIGEVLVDFIPLQKGSQLKDVIQFERVAGGAPANVAACVSTLGGVSVVLSKLGQDAFGDYLVNTLDQAGVDTGNIIRTNEANTGLAFVSLDQDGNRDFSFYRNPSADMLLRDDELDPNLFEPGDILHFCSVDLIEAPVKYAHKKAIALALQQDMLISFDPNVRLPLWDDPSELKNTILEFIPHAHILKISDEELEFITGETTILKALPQLMIGNVKIIIYTKGSKGSELYTKQHSYSHDGYHVNTVDTTGSGDSFIGAFLWQLLDQSRTPHTMMLTNFHEAIRFSNAVGALVATRKGGIPSMPSLRDVYQIMKTDTN